jgi:segregation and condensation protein B
VTALRKPPLSIVGAEPEVQSDENQRVLEAILFAAAEPVDEKYLKSRLPEDADLGAELDRLADHYGSRGVNLVRVAGKWALRTASDLGHRIAKDAAPPKKLSRAAIETLAIVAYHQPVTRAEIEEIRGVATSKGTIDTLLETGWIRLRGRRKAPGRPVTYGTTPGFLEHFGLDAVEDLPGLEELKGAGFIEGRVPSDFSVPVPTDADALREDEDPLEDDLLQPLDMHQSEAGKE